MYEFLTGPMFILSLCVFFVGLLARAIWYVRGLHWQLDRVAYGMYPGPGMKGAARSIGYLAAALRHLRLAGPAVHDHGLFSPAPGGGACAAVFAGAYLGSEGGDGHRVCRPCPSASPTSCPGPP